MGRRNCVSSFLFFYPPPGVNARCSAVRTLRKVMKRDNMLNESVLIARLLETGIASTDTIIGCLPEEIEHLEQTAGVRLPDEYRHYLRACGKSAGTFMIDCDAFYPELLGMQQQAKDVLTNWEDGRLSLPTSAFVFLMRDGAHLC